MNQVPARQRDVAMVFQNYALYPHMTVAENLGFGLRLRGTDRATRAAQVRKTAQSLNLDHLLDRRPGQLSGGQQQRVALGRAIVRQPQLFLLDEPLSNLDAQLRDETRTELKQLHQQLGITTLYVTHDQVEAMTLADQIVILDQGRIQQIGSPQQIYRQPANQMVATFLGSPAMNILPWRCGLAELTAEFQASPQFQTLLAAHPNLQLGIRPEHLQPASAPAHLSATVTVTEPLGRETLVKANLNCPNLEPNLEHDQPASIPIQFWAKADQPLQSGEQISLSLDLNELLAFDPISGKNLLLKSLPT
jgi:multiple sugar transport system ATP-binding protein